MICPLQFVRYFVVLAAVRYVVCKAMHYICKFNSTTSVSVISNGFVSDY